MPKQQIIVGTLVVLLCLHGLWKQQWLLENSKYGQWLARRAGASRARTILRAFLACGLIFGALLATNVIRPIRW